MIPIAELRAWVGAAASAQTDALLLQLEAHAVEQVALTTGAYLGPVDDFVDRVIGGGSTELRLPRFPVSEVISVQRSWLTDVVSAPEAVTDFVVRSPTLVRTGGAVWTLGAEFEVDYTAGYEDDEVPRIYRQAVLGIVKATYEAQAASLSADEEFKKESLGEYAYEAAGTGTDADSAAGTVRSILAQLPRRIRV